MTENSGTVAAIKGQMAKFSGIIAKGLPKPERKPVKELIYGARAGKDVKLSGASRSLNESLLSRRKTDHPGILMAAILPKKSIARYAVLGGGKVLDAMVVAIDPGDIRKRYASRMERLCKIRDGSEHEIGEGCWLAKAAAADTERKKAVPILEAHSQEAKDLKERERPM
jgi:hypothetical protein